MMEIAKLGASVGGACTLCNYCNREILGLITDIGWRCIATVLKSEITETPKETRRDK